MLNGKVSLMTSNQQFVKSFLTGISLAVMPVAGMNANAETLDEALTYTYVANPSLAAQRAYVKSVYEQINESKSGYKPTIAGQASYGYLYQRQRSRPGFSENESMPVNMGVNAVQPLFSGFGTVASVKAARHKFESEKAKLQDLEQSVLTQAVVAYTDVIRAIAVWKLNQNNEAVLKRQLDYTRDRFRVGELTKTDVAQAEARYAGAVASRIQAEGNVKVAYASYQETIGKMPDKIFEPEVPAAKLPQTLEDALAVADKNNPSVISAEYQEKQAKSGVDVAKSAYYPSLNLQASYLNSRANAHGSAPVYDAWGAYQGTMQTGRAREEDSSVKLVLDVPFYTAGIVPSKVAQAKLAERQAALGVVSVRRAVEQATTQAWENYQSTLAGLSSLQEQVRATELALDGVRHEEQAGTRTILDVLNAEQELLNARVSLVSAKKNLIDASYLLISAMGLMTPDNLDLDIDRYRKNAAPVAEKTVQSAESENKQPAEAEKEKASVQEEQV